MIIGLGLFIYSVVITDGVLTVASLITMLIGGALYVSDKGDDG